MGFEKARLEGLYVFTPRVFRDARGFFYESYNAELFEQEGLNTRWRQDNHAASRKGTVRGLHFASGEGQIKLIRCTRGAIWDVVVDIRPDSPTLGEWEAVELTEENQKQFYIPVGFAHGYAALTEGAECQYKCSEVYRPAVETEVLWNDPDIGIVWPVDHPIVSERDQKSQRLRDYLKGMGASLPAKRG